MLDKHTKVYSCSSVAGASATHHSLFLPSRSSSNAFFFFTVECRGGEDLVVGFLVRPCLVQFKNSVMFVHLLEIITSTKPLYAGGDFFYRQF